MPIFRISIAPSTILRSPEFVHLGDALLELLILALLVAVSLLLLSRISKLVNVALGNEEVEP